MAAWNKNAKIHHSLNRIGSLFSVVWEAMRFFSRGPRRHGRGRGRGWENRRVRFSVHFDSDSFEFRNFLAMGNLVSGNVAPVSSPSRLTSSNHTFPSRPRPNSQLTPLNLLGNNGWDAPVEPLNDNDTWGNFCLIVSKNPGTSFSASSVEFLIPTTSALLGLSFISYYGGFSTSIC